MTTQQLIDASLALIRETLARAEKPVVAWSAGKDSQVMLHLVRQIMPDVPVLHLRGFPSETKHAFADAEIERLGLNMVVGLQPYGRDIVGTGAHVEVIDIYVLGERTPIYYPIEAEPGYIPGPGSHCAIEKLNEPVGTESLDVDLVFIGQRNDDGDLVHGAMPLKTDVFEDAGIISVYPLKNWTEADIWAASELLNIPQNRARYNGDMSQNADYFPMCVECLKPTEAETIICPKINEPVYAYGRDLNLEQRRDEWRVGFTNVQGRET